MKNFTDKLTEIITEADREVETISRVQSILFYERTVIVVGWLRCVTSQPRAGVSQTVVSVATPR